MEVLKYHSTPLYKKDIMGEKFDGDPSFEMFRKRALDEADHTGDEASQFHSDGAGENRAAKMPRVGRPDLLNEPDQLGKFTAMGLLGSTAPAAGNLEDETKLSPSSEAMKPQSLSGLGDPMQGVQARQEAFMQPNDLRLRPEPQHGHPKTASQGQSTFFHSYSQHAQDPIPSPAVLQHGNLLHQNLANYPDLGPNSAASVNRMLTQESVERELLQSRLAESNSSALQPTPFHQYPSVQPGQIPASLGWNDPLVRSGVHNHQLQQHQHFQMAPVPAPIQSSSSRNPFLMNQFLNYSMDTNAIFGGGNLSGFGSQGSLPPLYHGAATFHPPPSSFPGLVTQGFPPQFNTANPAFGRNYPT
eukprot:CAMPEP_0178769510 /NCGR_PEP_ID=MMETSP0744-20121128/20869_1 /TAXON_ID=913974 /ORGANISM="Nitzschia punctata, Strain CCMP561" /LENGTH=357 /DNA_ID=CAMNT_0020425769 /DNA_START=640 /DNA_END=1709 /DNA_ORIENTATION=-